MFIDEACITIRSGKGGDGAVHFRREKYIPRGGPDGGDGGKGGDVILIADQKLTTLSMFRQKKHFIASSGLPGGKQNMTGKSGEDLHIKVPAGTVVYDDTSEKILGDLVEDGQRLIIATGGRGGRGNKRFATSRNQTPRVAEKGAPAEETCIKLELKLIADIGIIGVPNAGKSTLLAAVTNARPKIAAYPFTTLEPNLGVMDLNEDISLVIADIPGLIEGAHLGLGLGVEFLRHIQRTKMLIHLLNGLSNDPLADFTQINSELALFDPDLAEKPQIVAINKIDLPEVSERIGIIKENLMLDKKIKYIFGISALTRVYVKDLFWQAAEVLSTMPTDIESVELPTYHYKVDVKDFKIIKEKNGWRVSGESIERAAAMTYWQYYQSIRRFHRILQTLGIDKALKEAGIKEGDTVYIGNFELVWEE